MSLTPEQQRKKSMAEDEALRHARYAQADGSMKKENTQPSMSKAIDASEHRVNEATMKERADIGPQDLSPNASIRF